MKALILAIVIVLAGILYFHFHKTAKIVPPDVTLATKPSEEPCYYTTEGCEGVPANAKM